MYKFIAIGLIALDTLLFSLPSVKAQNLAKVEDCTATITAAQNNLKNGRNLELAIRREDISNDYPDHPENRNYNYLFLMEGAATDSIMNSPQLMKKIAKKIIDNCGSVGSVTFALNYSGWKYSIGLLPNGTIDFFECLEPDDNDNKINWGQEYCSL